MSQPYLRHAERSAAFRDAGGNTWYISRFTG